jgi:hypothetical protein
MGALNRTECLRTGRWSISPRARGGCWIITFLLLAASPPASAQPIPFTDQLFLPVGVTTGLDGTVFISSTPTDPFEIGAVLTAWTPQGTFLRGVIVRPSVGYIGGQAIHLATDPVTGWIVALVEDGRMFVVAPDFLQGGFLFNGLSLKSFPVDLASPVWDVEFGQYAIVSGVLPGSAHYGDLAILQRGAQADLLVTAISGGSRPFVMRVRITTPSVTAVLSNPSAPAVARVLVSSRAAAQTGIPSGVAIAQSGIAFTTLPVCANLACIGGKDVGVKFHLDFYEGQGATPAVQFGADPVASRGISSDWIDQFFFAANGVIGAAQCLNAPGTLGVTGVAFQSGFACFSPNRAGLPDSYDTAVSLDRQYVFMTVPNQSVVMRYRFCLTSLSTSSASFTSAGGSGNVSVEIGAGCGWTAATADSWITITSGASGTDSGAVSYTVAPNPGAAERTATIVIGSSILSITQAGLPAGAISGLTFHDLDADGVKDPGEPGLAGWTIYLDANDNATLDPGESSALTISGGAYSLGGLEAGTYLVREVQQDGWVQTHPGPNTGWTVNLSAGQQVEAIDFGNAVPDIIWSDDFEDGTLSGWSSALTDGDDLRVTSAAALEGSHGLQGDVDDTTSLYVQDDAPDGESRYRVRFLFDPNGFDPGVANGKHRVRLFIALGGSPSVRVVTLVLRLVNGEYGLLARVRRDDGTRANTPVVAIEDGPHTIEVEWRRASAPGADDGALELWIDGVSRATLTAIDNDGTGIDFARLGALTVKPGATGTLFWDAFQSWR